MILDNEEQRGIILNALMAQPIQGDFQGIVESLPRFIAVVDAVKAATIEDRDKP